MTPPQPSSPICIPHHAATTLAESPEPCRACSYPCRGLKVSGSSAKAHLKSCEPVKPPKNLVFVSCQEKACLGLKCVQKSHSLMKNCACQSTTVELHLLHINDSTSAALALQYPNIGNISIPQCELSDMQILRSGSPVEPYPQEMLPVLVNAIISG